MIHNDIDNFTRVDNVHINSKNIDFIRDFYTNGLMLNIISEDSRSISFGKNKPLIVFHDEKNLPNQNEDDAGLYHVAIIYSSKNELATVIANIITKYPKSYSGCSNHDVSEAFYFTDPEGNGIELYVDKPKSEWKWNGKTVQMSTKSLDIIEFIKNYADGSTDGEVLIGHIHLKVGNIDEAKMFYVDVLGFDVTSELRGALFISKDKYHHNIGLNVWESNGAGFRKETIGLKSYNIVMPNINKLVKKLDKSKINYTQENKKIILNDPWGNNIVLTEE